MKTFFSIFILCMIPCCISAQTAIYKYDGNGNVISRTLQDLSKEYVTEKMVNDLVTDVDIQMDGINDKLIVKVNGKSNKEVDVLLYDTSSRLINKESSAGVRHELDCSSIPDGVYIVEIRYGGETCHSQKIIKN